MGLSPSAAQRTNTVRLRGQTVERVLDELDRTEGLRVGIGKARWYRYRMHVVVHLRQPGAPNFIPYTVPTRLLNAGGLVFAHGGFVHVGRACIAQLITMHGTWGNVEGLVSRCTHLEGAIHEIETRFGQPIDVSLYCPEAVPSKVLLADEDPLVARIMAAYLTRLGARVEFADSITAACEMALIKQYDLLVFDTELPDANLLEAIHELRRRGCVGKIVATLSHEHPEEAQRLLKAGCDECLSKPVGPGGLRPLLQLVREEPLFSTLEPAPDLTALIEEFVQAVRAQSHEVWEAYQSGDRERLSKLVRVIKRRADAYGFTPVAQAALDLQSALASKGPLSEVAGQLHKLRACCLRVRSTTPGTGQVGLGAQAGGSS